MPLTLFGTNYANQKGQLIIGVESDRDLYSHHLVRRVIVCALWREHNQKGPAFLPTFRLQELIGWTVANPHSAALLFLILCRVVQRDAVRCPSGTFMRTTEGYASDKNMSPKICSWDFLPTISWRKKKHSLGFHC